MPTLDAHQELLVRLGQGGWPTTEAEFSVGTLETYVLIPTEFGIVKLVADMSWGEVIGYHAVSLSTSGGAYKILNGKEAATANLTYAGFCERMPLEP